jgi:hypothetical protein
MCFPRNRVGLAGSLAHVSVTDAKRMKSALGSYPPVANGGLLAYAIELSLAVIDMEADRQIIRRRGVFIQAHLERVLQNLIDRSVLLTISQPNRRFDNAALMVTKPARATRQAEPAIHTARRISGKISSLYYLFRMPYFKKPFDRLLRTFVRLFCTSVARDVFLIGRQQRRRKRGLHIADLAGLDQRSPSRSSGHC